MSKMVNPINNAPAGPSKSDSSLSEAKNRQSGTKKTSAANPDAAHLAVLSGQGRSSGITAEPIRDVDSAYEAVNVIRDMLMQQSTAAINAQANLSPQRVLGLI